MLVLLLILKIILLASICVGFFNALYLAIFSVAGATKSRKQKSITPAGKRGRFLFLLPGFREDAVILDSVQSVMAQNFPAENFSCIVIADDFNPETIAAIKNTGAEVFEITPDPKRNKAKSLRTFLSADKGDAETVVILDADNCIEKDFLQRINDYVQSGNEVVQARRVAKNEENGMSRMDSLSEIINNHIFRKGQRALGFSASLIGSGMIIKKSLLCSLLEDMNVYSGFDKEMELRILEKKIRIEYAEEIIVLDEKVSADAVFVNQRRRWTYAQFYFLRKNLGKSFRLLFSEGNADYFNKVVQFALLPRVVVIGLAMFLPAVAWIAGNEYFVGALISSALSFISVYLASRSELRRNDILAFLSKFPIVFTGMLKAMITSGQAAGKFIHTPHKANH